MTEAPEHHLGGAPGAEANEAPERIIARYRSHGRRLVLPVLVLMADAGLSAYYLGRLPEEWQNQAATGASIAIAVLLGLLPYLSWLATRYTITNRRVISARGLFARERQEVSLRRGFDVVLRRRGLQALWRSGDVTVHGGGEHPLVFRDVPDARLIASALTRLGEESGATNAGL